MFDRIFNKSIVCLCSAAFWAGVTEWIFGAELPAYIVFGLGVGVTVLVILKDIKGDEKER
jgi:hypothetical protein